MKLLKALAVGFTLTTALIVPTQVSAAPLVALIGGAAFAATLGGQLLAIGLSIAAAVAIPFVSQLLFPKQSTYSSTLSGSSSSTAADPVSVEYGERVSRNGIFGTCLTDTHVVHLNEYSDSTILQYVGVVADAWCTGIASIFINGRQHAVTETTLSANNEHKRYIVTDYEDVIDLRFHDGRPGQAADASLVANTVGWTSAKTFSGMAYFVAELTSDREKFSGSIPEIMIVPIGQRIYDIRKDTSAGGSGAHRITDPTTWEYTANPAVQAYHYLRGFYFNSKRVLGVGYTAPELDADSFITAMNVCDQVVSVPGGGTRARYECHMAYQDIDTFATVLDMLCQSMGGYWSDTNGIIKIYAGVAKSSVLTITDDDLCADETIEFNPGRPGEVLLTGIQGTYMHSTDYKPTPYTSIEPPEFLSSNWYPHVQTVDYRQVRHAHQAYLLAKQYLFGIRYQATASITLDIKDILIQQGDWITWTSTGVRGEHTWEVKSCKYDFQKTRVHLSLQEVNVLTYSDTSTAGDLVEPDRSRPVSGYQTVVADFTVHAITLQGSSGETLPALEFDYAPIFDPAVVGVEIYYRIKGGATDSVGNTQAEGDIFKAVDRSVDDGVMRVTNGVQPGYIYEANANLLSLPGRAVIETGWVTADTTTGSLGAVVAVGDNTITIAKLTDELQKVVGLLTATDGTGVYGLIQAAYDEIERQANASLTSNETYSRRTTLLERHTQSAAAAIVTEGYVRAEEDSALAQQIMEVSASVGTLLADGLLQFQASVDTPDVLSYITAKVRVSNTAAYSEAAWILIAQADGSGGTISAFGVYADLFYVVAPAGDITQAFTYDGTYLTVHAAKIDTIISGKLQRADGTMIVDLDNKRIKISA